MLHPPSKSKITEEIEDESPNKKTKNERDFETLPDAGASGYSAKFTIELPFHESKSSFQIYIKSKHRMCEGN